MDLRCGIVAMYWRSIAQRANSKKIREYFTGKLIHVNITLIATLVESLKKSNHKIRSRIGVLGWEKLIKRRVFMKSV